MTNNYFVEQDESEAVFVYFSPYLYLINKGLTFVEEARQTFQGTPEQYVAYINF